MTNPCKFPPREKIIYTETPETRRLLKIWKAEIKSIAVVIILASIYMFFAMLSHIIAGTQPSKTLWPFGVFAFYSIFCLPGFWIGFAAMGMMGPLGLVFFVAAAIIQWNLIWEWGKNYILRKKKNPIYKLFIVLLLAGILNGILWCGGP
ncbi:MAG: hypothetical protein NTX50_29155, partial [Candidatus Sumerlaeota bacterium]|nr:hypothetical protein [Candidatus Sumerlaeota bacterium]